jgi:maltooligosyltrehalose trehalohydrolase
MYQTNRRHYLIVEMDLNDPRFINPLEKQGYGMDAQWVDEFHHALWVNATGEKQGYYSDFTGVHHLAKAYKDAYVYDGQYSVHRKKHFGTKTENPGHQFIVFSQNHDQIGNRMLGERTGQLTSFEMQKLLAAAVMAGPYLPLLFMGEEWSEAHPFSYFVSHTDPKLAEAVTHGRKEEFEAFHAMGDAPDPMAAETFLQSKLQWDLLDREPHETMLRYYKALIELRKKQPILHNLHREQLSVQCNEEHQTLMLHRWHENKDIVCLMNFSKTEQKMELPAYTNKWHKIFDSAEPQWRGPVSAPDTISQHYGSLIVRIQPESILLYKNHCTHEG